MAFDTYKRLAALRPENNQEQELYIVPQNKQIVGNLYICNQDIDTTYPNEAPPDSTANHFYNIAHTIESGDATVNDWIVYNMKIVPGDTHEISRIHMGTGETLRIKVDAPNRVSFVLSGLIIDK